MILCRPCQRYRTAVGAIYHCSHFAFRVRDRRCRCGLSLWLHAHVTLHRLLSSLHTDECPYVGVDDDKYFMTEGNSGSVQYCGEGKRFSEDVCTCMPAGGDPSKTCLITSRSITSRHNCYHYKLCRPTSEKNLLDKCFDISKRKFVQRLAVGAISHLSQTTFHTRVSD